MHTPSAELHHRGYMRQKRGALAGYGMAAVATCVAVLAGGTRHPELALVLIAGTSCAIGTEMTIVVATASGAISWLFYDGFIIGRHSDLAWHGAVTGWQAAVFLAAGAAGGLGAAAWRRARASTRQRAGGQIATPTGSQSHRYGENVVYLASVRYHREVRKTSA